MLNKKINLPLPIAIIILLIVIGVGIMFIILLWPKYTGHYNVEIKEELSQIQVAAQEYYDVNGSYTGFTTDLSPPKCSDKTYTIQVSPDGKQYLIYARLCWSNTRLLKGKRDVFWCIDSGGFSGKVLNEDISDDIYSCTE